MHEASLVSALCDQIDSSIAPHPGAIVRVVHVRVGELAGVEPELFKTAFEVLREARSCRGAALQVLAVPAEWHCIACDALLARGGILKCVACGGEARLTQGGDVFLDRLELEVPDV
jgi:hydrogenase nickel incorporation protein HypA/HybF